LSVFRRRRCLREHWCLPADLRARPGRGERGRAAGRNLAAVRAAPRVLVPERDRAAELAACDRRGAHRARRVPADRVGHRPPGLTCPRARRYAARHAMDTSAIPRRDRLAGGESRGPGAARGGGDTADSGRASWAAGHIRRSGFADLTDDLSDRAAATLYMMPSTEQMA